MGKWESCFWISTFPRGRRRGCGNVGIALFAVSKGCGKRGKLAFGFPLFPWPVISTALPAVVFHALCLRPNFANSFCFSFCILVALAVSLSPPAFWFIVSTVSSGFKCRARSGSCRRISHGVAYQR